MTTILLSGYSAVAVVAVVHAFASIARAPRRPGERIDRMDRAILVVVALVASLLWPLFVPVLLTGWVMSGMAAAEFTAIRRRLSRKAHPAVAEGKLGELAR